jgi:hypothetical protein
LQSPALKRETVSVRANGVPGFTCPSAGSERMSDRFKRSSTKYGPSVCSGRATHKGPGVPARADLGVRLPAISQAAPVAPSNVTTSRRERRRPTSRSSCLIGVLIFFGPISTPNGQALVPWASPSRSSYHSFLNIEEQSYRWNRLSHNPNSARKISCGRLSISSEQRCCHPGRFIRSSHVPQTVLVT